MLRLIDCELGTRVDYSIIIKNVVVAIVGRNKRTNEVCLGGKSLITGFREKNYSKAGGDEMIDNVDDYLSFKWIDGNYICDPVANNDHKCNQCGISLCHLPLEINLCKSCIVLSSL